MKLTIKKHRIERIKLFIFICLLICLPACMFIKPENLIIISPQKLHKLMLAEDIFLVDVHVPEQNHIKGTDFFIPFYKIKKNIAKFPLDKETNVYLYCKSGPMGNAAARALFKAGYKNIYNLQDGTDGWEKAGFSSP